MNPLEGLAVQTRPAPTSGVRAYPLSPKQEALIARLLTEKDLTGIDVPVSLHSLTGGWNGTGSALIEKLFKAPRVGAGNAEPRLSGASGLTTEADQGSLIPTGYYGVDGKRYKVDVPTRGKWAGWTFFKTGSDYYDQVRLGGVRPGGTYKGKAEEVFNTIAADPAAAGREYARITGACYACNRKLEDPTSVELGIGPVCRSK